MSIGSIRNLGVDGEFSLLTPDIIDFAGFTDSTQTKVINFEKPPRLILFCPRSHNSSSPSSDAMSFNFIDVEQNKHWRFRMTANATWEEPEMVDGLPAQISSLTSTSMTYNRTSTTYIQVLVLVWYQKGISSIEARRSVHWTATVDSTRTLITLHAKWILVHKVPTSTTASVQEILELYDLQSKKAYYVALFKDTAPPTFIKGELNFDDNITGSSAIMTYTVKGADYYTQLAIY